MSSINRHSQQYSTSTSFGKRPVESGSAGKVASSAALRQKRVALSDISNAVGRKSNVPLSSSSSTIKGKHRATASQASTLKKTSITHVRETSLKWNTSVAPSSTEVKPVACRQGPLVPVNNVSSAGPVGCILPRSENLSPIQLDESSSMSIDESMSSCSSIKSSDIEYVDNADSSAVASLETRATLDLQISEKPVETGYTSTRDALMRMEIDDVVDIDGNHDDAQACATLACDIHKHLRKSEGKKRPSANYMDIIQKDINPSMRAILVDWLVEVAEEYRLVPDTLFLTVNFIDRYLSANEMNRQRLQLLGVACMLIASKYEEICAPQVEEFCYITDNTYFREEVLQMEADVLKHLKFEMSSVTTKCFLRRFVRAAQWADEVPLLQLEFLANYAAELTLLEYSFLSYVPSMIAASAVFLAKFVLNPRKNPWNPTLDHYTLYKPSELHECVNAMHLLFCNSSNSSLPAIREKYSQHKYKFVAKKCCPSAIPQEFFQDTKKL